MVSPEALKLNELLRNAPKAVDMDLLHQREAGEHAEDMISEPEGVRFEDAPAVGGLWATPHHWDGESAIMYLYGGGYVISSPHSRRKLAGHLANASGSRARPQVPPGSRTPFPCGRRRRSGRLSVAARGGSSPREGRHRRGFERRRPHGRRDAQAARGRRSTPRRRCPHIAVGGPGLHRRDARDERHSGPHRDQGQPAADGGPVPPRCGPAQPACLTPLCRPIWFAAPPGGRRWCRSAAR
jgi:hypothetical protein